MSKVIFVKKISSKSGHGLYPADTPRRNTASVLQRSHYTDADESHQITRAREAAEALFAPNCQVSEELARESSSLTGPLTRKPRVFRVEPAPTHHEKVTASVRPEPQIRRNIPKAHFGRIRTWLRYGMTVSQVAELYGVPVEQVEHIFGRG
jgi:hypothetical protein